MGIAYRQVALIPQRVIFQAVFLQVLVDRPVIQYVVEEGLASAADEVIIINSHDKKSIEEHFTPNPALEAEYRAYANSRADFNTRLEAGEAKAVESRWQRFYHRGETPGGLTAPDHHSTKRRMKPPLVLHPAAAAPSAGPPSIYEEAGYFVRPMTRPPNA